MKRYGFILIVLLAFVVASCSSTTEETPIVNDTVTEESIVDSDNTTTEEMSDNTSEATAEGVTESEDTTISYNGPDWAGIQLTDARSGETFALSDLAGKVVMVHAMATWCSNCRQQQGNLRSVYSDFDSDEVVFISMSVENNLENLRLAEYANDNQFDWIFVVAPPELVNALTTQFGRTITNPPSTPRFFVLADGSVSALSTGRHSSQDLVNEIAELSNS